MNDETPAGTNGAESDAVPAPKESAVSEAIAAAREAAESGELQFTEPRIAEPGVPAGEGERPAVDLDAGAGTIVRLPPRQEGGEPLEIAVDDLQAAGALRAAIRGGVRRDQLQAALQALEDERSDYLAMRDLIETDPASFVMEYLRPDQLVELAKHVLSHPDVREKAWELEGDPDRLKAERLERRDAVRTEVTARAEARHYARAVRDAIERMIPDQFSDERAQALRDDLLRDARDFMLANPSSILRPADLPGLLEQRLRLYGVDAQAAAAAATAEGAPPPPRRVRDAVERGRARSVGQKFLDQAKAQKRAAAIPGAGAGTPTAGPALPKGQSIKERVATMKKRMGLA